MQSSSAPTNPCSSSSSSISENVFHGDFGYSFSQYPRTVADVIRSSIGWTIGLQLPAIIVGWILGNVLGVLAAYRRGGFDKFLMPGSLFMSSLPAFGMAIVLLMIFAVTLRWFPTSGGYGFDKIPNLSWDFAWSVFVHYQMPFWALVLDHYRRPGDRHALHGHL